jgi:hypothetical protein
MDPFGKFGLAWERMRRLLFVGSNAAIWFSFGLMFFLASCVEDGGGGGGNFNQISRVINQSRHSGGSYGSSYDDSMGHALGNALSHGGFGGLTNGLGGIGVGEMVIIGIVAMVFVIPLVLLFSWLGSRGQAMSFTSIATGNSTLGMQWSATQDAGHRIFLWHLMMMGLGLAIVVPLGGAGAGIVFGLEDNETAMVAALVVLSLLAVAIIIPLSIYGIIMRNFVFPLMVSRGYDRKHAWSLVWSNLKGGDLFVFLIARFVITLAGGILGMLVVLFTCCVGALPVLNQTLMAPFHVFERAHSLYCLAALGPEFNVLEDFPTPGFGGGFGQPWGPAPTPGPMPPPVGGYGSPGAGGYGPPGGGGYGPPPAGGFGGPY